MRNVKSITPNDPANFTPELGNYKTLKPFRYWCQKVLPLVYDDTLSYYELLCKVVDYLNKTMEDVETLNGDVTNLHTAYDELQSYVNNYFTTLDVQEEINNILDKMAESGELYEIIRRYTDPIVNGQNDKIDVLKARMDTFSSLPDGSTSGNAELSDIRVGYYGKKYPSAGDAVRAQVGELNDYIGNFVNDLNCFLPKDFNKESLWEDGAVDNTGDIDNVYHTRMRIKGFIDKSVKKLKCDDLYSMAVFRYNGTSVDHTYPFKWVKSVSLEQDKYNYRLCVKKDDNSAIGTDISKHYRHIYLITDKIKTVGKNGRGQYASLTSAVADASDGDIILVASGVYENETVEAWGKNITVIGCGKYNTIIKNTLDDYDNPPLEASLGTWKNIGFYVNDSTQTHENGAYACHIENGTLTGKEVHFEDCYFYSKNKPALGIGMRPNSTIYFENCKFEVENGSSFFFHNSSTIGEQGNNQHIVCKNCEFQGGLHNAISYQEISADGIDNSGDFTAINCVFYKKDGVGGIYRIGDVVGNLSVTTFKSYGNNQPLLNHTDN